MIKEAARAGETRTRVYLAGTRSPQSRPILTSQLHRGGLTSNPGYAGFYLPITLTYDAFPPPYRTGDENPPSPTLAAVASRSARGQE